MSELNIAFGLRAYLPRTYTWVHNQMKFIQDVHILVLAKKLDDARFAYPPGRHEVFTFPDLKILRGRWCPSILMRGIRFLLAKAGIQDRVFAASARRHGCSLVHAHFGFAGWEFLPTARRLGVPLIVSFYGYDYEWIPHHEPEWRAKYAELFKAAALFLTEGEYGRCALIRQGAPERKVKVHHLGVDVDAIQFSLRSIKRGDPLRLLQVASFVEKKGHDVLIKAVRLLADRGSGANVELTLVGDGARKPAIEEMVKREGLERIVKFVGHIPYSELHREMHEHHVFVHPSVTTSDGDCEGGAPVVLLDAQATGMPVISTTHCDIPEEVLNEVTGLLVPENDPIALAGAIERMLNQPSLISAFGTAGREHVEEHYSARKQAVALRGIYDRLLAAGESGRMIRHIGAAGVDVSPNGDEAKAIVRCLGGLSGKGAGS